MRSARGRVARSVALACLAAALALGGWALLDSGWGPALRSVADRVLPYPEVAMWAKEPAAGSRVGTYADATGSGANYVYLVQAADASGSVRELQLIFFGREADGREWLLVEARGGSGVHYREVEEGEVPEAAREALG